MMEQGNGHYVGYWTVPADTVANGAVIEVKLSMALTTKHDKKLQVNCILMYQHQLHNHL